MKNFYTCWWCAHFKRIQAFGIQRGSCKINVISGIFSEHITVCDRFVRREDWK